jgi:hypothetical protein
MVRNGWRTSTVLANRKTSSAYRGEQGRNLKGREREEEGDQKRYQK